jgi:hypothetical protein
VLELNTVIRSTGTDLSVVQSGNEVLLVDHTDATVSIVDPATSTAGESIALPPDQPQVFLAGTRVAIYAAGTGQLWLLPQSQLQNFDATTPATLSLGTGTVVQVAPDGTLVAFSPGRVRSTGQRRDLGPGGPALEGRPRRRSDDVQITAVGDAWAVLDTTTRKLAVDGHIVSLSGIVSSGSTASLQQPGDASSRCFWPPTGLYAVPLDGSAPRRCWVEDRARPRPPSC